MSGGPDYGIPYIPPEESNCSKLRIKTHLSSPVPSILATLKLGDLLAVRYTPPLGPLQAVTGKNQIAGSIVTSKQVDIIKCINDGFTFQAKVITISGGKCDIEITAS